jgi:hypothetical protein
VPCRPHERRKRARLQEGDYGEVEAETLLLRVVDDEGDERTDDDIDADDGQGELRPADGLEIGLGIPEEGHAGEHRDRNERADPEVHGSGLPARQRLPHPLSRLGQIKGW